MIIISFVTWIEIASMNLGKTFQECYLTVAVAALECRRVKLEDQKFLQQRELLKWYSKKRNQICAENILHSKNLDDTIENVGPEHMGNVASVVWRFSF